MSTVPNQPSEPAARQAATMTAEQLLTETHERWQREHREWLAALKSAGFLDKETADALISLWQRRDRLTRLELDAIRAAADETVGSAR